MRFIIKFVGAALAAGLTLAASQPAWSNITNVTDFGAGNLSFDYGSSGFGSLSAWYVLGPSNVVSSSTVAGLTGLGFSAHVSPALPLDPGGTSQLLITYELTNIKNSTTNPLSFIAEVDPNGGANRTDIAASHMVIGAGEPDRFEIDDFNTGLLDQNIQAGLLNNTDSCGPSCDVDFALQWNIPALHPGQTSRLIVSLSDNGQHNSQSFLSATHVDPEEVLTFSGTAQVVPEPDTWLLLCAGLGVTVLGFARRRERLQKGSK